jgi:hypothetical protein
MNRMGMNTVVTMTGFAVVLSIMLVASAAFSQEKEAVSGDSDASDVGIADKIAVLEQRLAAQEDKIQALEALSKLQDDEVAALKAENQTTREELEAAREERDDIGLQLMENVTNREDKFQIYGFMDLNYAMSFPQNDDSILFAQNQTKHNSFLMNNINLYFASQMADTLSALAEVRFTFSPLGDITSVPKVVYTNGVRGASQGEFVRVDTGTTNPYGAKFRLGGVFIERAHFDFAPRDWFKIRGGRYLTPYGIWNEDHGPTVCLTALMPFMQVFEYVPSAQTGIMVFGQLYPTDLLTIQYAVTLSNGRSPTDAFFDMDDNKAVGVRGKVQLSSTDWKLALGGYGYYGEYTNWSQEIRVAMTDDFTALDPTADPALTTATVTEENYMELIGAADIEASFKGLRLAGEFVWRKVDYKVPPRSPEMQAAFLGTDPLQVTWQGNKIAMSGYGLLSYTLPLKLDGTTITPFAGIDLLYPDDATDFESWTIVQFGANVKPGAFLTLKGSGYMINPQSDQYGGHIWYIAGQAAVSF